MVVLDDDDDDKKGGIVYHQLYCHVLCGCSSSLTDYTQSLHISLLYIRL